MSRITSKEFHAVADRIARITGRDTQTDSWMNHYAIRIDGRTIASGVTRRECVSNADAWISGYYYGRDAGKE